MTTSARIPPLLTKNCHRPSLMPVICGILRELPTRLVGIQAADVGYPQMCLSFRYVSLIRRGERTPHPRHWQALLHAAAPAAEE